MGATQFAAILEQTLPDGGFAPDRIFPALAVNPAGVFPRDFPDNACGLVCRGMIENDHLVHDQHHAAKSQTQDPVFVSGRHQADHFHCVPELELSFQARSAQIHILQPPIRAV